MFNVTEQRLVDEKNNILKDNGCRFQNQKKYKETGQENREEEGWFFGYGHAGQDVFMKECVVVLKDCIVPNVEKERSSVFIIKMNMQITNEDMTIFEKM